MSTVSERLSLRHWRYFSFRFKERLLCGAVIATLVIAVLHFQQTASEEREKRLEELLQVLQLQKAVIAMQKELVTTAKDAVDTAQQGRLDCSQSLEALTKRQWVFEEGLGLHSLQSKGR